MKIADLRKPPNHLTLKFSMTSITAYISYDDALISTLIHQSLSSLIPSLTLVSNASTANLQWSTYESLSFEHILSHPKTTLCNSYIFRKALIRKHFLANTITQWLVKNPESILKRSVPRTFLLECDFAEYLDEALNESFELRDALQENERNKDGKEGDKGWFILKPSMADRGQGIRLFSTMRELEEIFEEFEAQEEDDDDDDEKEETHSENDVEREFSRDTGVIANQLRHFVVQEYIPNPLLLLSPSPLSRRKFHLRTYIVSLGAIKVYVWSEILALFASKEYSPPSATADLSGHLTNTCLQTGEEKSDNVTRFWELPLEEGVLRGIWRGICDVAGEVFTAAAQGQQMHFQVLFLRS